MTEETLVVDDKKMLKVLRMLLKAANARKRGEYIMEFHDNGICYHSEYMYLGQPSPHSYIYQWCSDLFVGWKHHSGISYIPISNNDDIHKWDGENLKLRIDLLRYSIRKLKARIEQEQTNVD